MSPRTRGVRHAHGAPRTLAAAVVLIAIAAALVPTPPALVERWYSTTTYLAMQARVTSAANVVPFALLDVFIAATAGAWISALVLDIARSAHGSRMSTAARIGMRTAVVAASLYVGFLSMWGLNYRRVPLMEKLQFDAARVSPDAARVMAATVVERVNALYEPAHRAGEASLDSTGSALAAAFARVQRELGARREAILGRPKRSLLELYLRRAAVDGMTDPYFLETLVARDLLAFERPFVLAHEWSHLAGYADEGDANFAGWLTCLRGGEVEQYSGWLFLYGEIAARLSAADRAELAARLAPGPRADRRAMADRIRRNVNPRLSAAGWRVYDTYLKANRVEAGAASYAHVVRLVLGVKFGPDWTPLKK